MALTPLYVHSVLLHNSLIMPYFLKDIQREGLDNDDNEIGKRIVVTFKAKAPLAISSENT